MSNQSVSFFNFIRSLELSDPPSFYSITDFIIKHNSRGDFFCEAIISPDGKICFAEPSYQEVLIALTGEERESLYLEMPISASPLFWLVEKTKCVAIYYEFCIANKDWLTKKQIATIHLLKKHKVVAPNNEIKFL